MLTAVRLVSTVSEILDLRNRYENHVSKNPSRPRFKEDCACSLAIFFFRLILIGKSRISLLVLRCYFLR